MDGKPETGHLDMAKVLFIGDEDDLLHSGYSSTIKHDGRRFPSVIHYAYARIIGLMNHQEEQVLDLMYQPSASVASRAQELIKANLPAGHDMASAAPALLTYRQTFLLEGLKLRVEQDEEFKNNLMQATDSLLIVCDPKDSELGIGMADTAFLEFFKAGNYKMQDLSDWMLNESIRPKAIGQNILGFLLMYLRFELKEAERLKVLKAEEFTFHGLSTDQVDDEEKSMKISTSSHILSLSGILKPLSNYYKYTFDVKGLQYRSVEHYVYERLLEILGAEEHYIHKIRSVPQPVHVRVVADKIIDEMIATTDLEEEDVKKKKLKMDRWKQTAMKNKISKDVELQRLLLNTGNAFLIESNPYGDNVWTVGTDEYELQHLLTKPKIDISLLADYMTGAVEKTASLQHLGMNKTGILLMELRKKFSTAQFVPYSYISPPEVNLQRMGFTNNIICFTPESIFHPFYPVKLVICPELTVPTPIHYVVLFSCRFLGIKPAVECELMVNSDGADVWYQFNNYINNEMNLPLDKIKAYFATERQRLIKIALAMMFQQHPAILRSLLETEDFLFVYCSRYSTIEAELTSGLREREFRRLFQESESDVSELISIFLNPLAKRPPFIGGNRLGFILMELRRSFRLGGCYPSQYEALPMPWEGKLGTNSPMENYACDRPIIPMNKINFCSVWADPYILHFKNAEDYVAMNRFVPVMIGANFREAKKLAKELVEENAEREKLLRAVDAGVKAMMMNALMTGLNESLTSAERKFMKLKDVELSMKVVNQHFEEEKKAKALQVTKPPPQQIVLPVAFPSMLGPPMTPKMMPPQQMHQQMPPPQMHQQMPPPQMHQQMPPPQIQHNNQGWRSDFRNEDRKSFGRDNFRNDNRNMRPDNRRIPFGSHQSRNGSNNGNRNNFRNNQGPVQQRRYSPMRDVNQDRAGGGGQDRVMDDRRRPFSPKEPSRNDRDKDKGTPKSKKPKRVVDESELSEGEILSSDED